MEYVSAEWVVFPPTGERVIKAVGDDGVEYWIPSAETDVPPWPEFMAGCVKYRASLDRELVAKRSAKEQRQGS